MRPKDKYSVVDFYETFWKAMIEYGDAAWGYIQFSEKLKALQDHYPEVDFKEVYDGIQANEHFLNRSKRT